MTVAIIGATGPIGRAVAERLLRTGEGVAPAAQPRQGRQPWVMSSTQRSFRSGWTTRRPWPGRRPEPAWSSWPWAARDGGEHPAHRDPGAGVSPRTSGELVSVTVLNAGPDSVGINQPGHLASTSLPRPPGFPRRRSVLPSSLPPCWPAPRRRPHAPGPASPTPAAWLSSTPATPSTSRSPSRATRRPGDSTTTSPGPAPLLGPRPSRCFPTSWARR